MKKARGLIAVTVAVLMLSACGQPDVHYVRDEAGTTYFAVPSSFTQLDSEPIEQFLSGGNPSSVAAAVRAQRVWSTAFDQAAQPSVDHLLGSPDPFIYATVHQLTEEQRNAVSLNRLRDFILPVTDQVRELYAQKAAATGQPLLFTNFMLIKDEELTLEDGARGVRVRFEYQIGQDMQMFDHTAILDAKGATVSVMLIGCESVCFRKRAAEFDKIESTFKLLRLPG
ncbi:hypothetical protein GBF35_36025 [Nonomuraea phyllanthi]|uniref:hypothetical protein n=1 Tax=Nonomuraea phyllanthi TaxID=2219224 RepID=UPI0012932300|nr:hypothetical protein [Nonomuraea phyllanthi]QFY11279.1 hypothetical protein GBF35_36025 [Nonomuraea phyllanthi]